MINQKLARKWLKDLENPKNLKTIDTLTSKEFGRLRHCCLGLYLNKTCKLRPKIIKTEMGFMYEYLKQNDVLPNEKAKELNITTDGRLTSLGSMVLKDNKLDDNINDYGNNLTINSLTKINDSLFNNDANFKNVAKVIRALVNYEKKFKKDCFEPYIKF